MDRWDYQYSTMDRWDYQYSQEAYNYDLKIIWRCTICGDERESEPGVNDGGQCPCGGRWSNCGESYRA